jgi:hypothetical protein
MFQVAKHLLVRVLLALLILAGGVDLCVGEAGDHPEALPVTGQQGSLPCPCPGSSEAPQRSANCSCSAEASVSIPGNQHSHKVTKRIERQVAKSAAHRLIASRGPSTGTGLETVSPSVTYRQITVLRI